MSEPQRRIEDYALIGDGETAALIHRDATIEWLCFPRFDSEACLAALLDDRENGCWRLGPVKDVTSTTRRYRADSLVLETEVATSQGKVRIIDFMPIRGENADVVRIVEGVEGEVEMVGDLALRFDYGRIHPLIRKVAGHHVVAIAGPNGVSLHCDVPVEVEERSLRSRFKVRAGERKSLVLTWFASHEEVPQRIDPRQALEDTDRFWSDWSAQIRYRGEYAELVHRSLVTLKALTHRPTGGIIAAPTASLPETPGGTRNWDYRYCWLRDSTLMLLAFERMGLLEEASQWTQWLARTVGGKPISLQPFFAVDGARRLPEWEADWLAGYENSKPVRFGNGAVGQLQLDIYGEVTDALFQAIEDGVEASGEAETVLRMLADKLEEVWECPDAGIWESRGENRHHTYSKAMCWVAFDRTAALLHDREPEKAERYRDLAQRIRQRVLNEGFDPEAGCFTDTFGGNSIDAAVLRLPLVGFIDANDPKMVKTVSAIEQNLVRDGLVWRYDPDQFDDGIGSSEGAFVAACFWLAEVYHLQGREADARSLFERVIGYANDLGLIAEELQPGINPRQLGNFPQGLSHLSLVSAAQRLFGQADTNCDRKPEATGAAAQDA
ncbi:glycoside hydrolase family 15 protein [Novosphingobium aquimarinum]|uniref:glycoside hydrolase family 15 protein n=1 Tax=Novosphingobium aquimarinum TaxID=2682494 RepID=UPI0018DB5EDD|nr:glycoside hydrolase family 15 protein [Novosphingobium aquimarinum]